MGFKKALLIFMVLVGCLALGQLSGYAAEEAHQPFEMGLGSIPLQYAIVSGDRNKFQSHHWQKDNFVVGAEDIEAKYKTEEGFEVEMDGSALVEDGDYDGGILVKKEGLGFLKFEYEQFRKYYDDTGGVYYPFQQLSGMSIGRDLYLDIGKIGVTLGIQVEDFPELELEYEHGYKNGSKSRLTWGEATEAGRGQRKIVPSWQEIDETEDVLTLRLKDELAGFRVDFDQSYEFVTSDNARYEQYLSTNATAADKKIRIQSQSPESNLFTTTLKVSRWFLEEKIFTSSAYQFQHLTNKENEDLREYDQYYSLTTYSNPEQKVGAFTENQMDLHRWTANLSAFPWEWLDLATKLRAELSSRNGNSSYPADDRPQNVGHPDGIIDHTEYTNTDGITKKMAESFSVRYKAIPKTALYSEVELQQNDYWLSEDRNSIGPVPSTGEIVFHETMNNQRQGSWTIGGNYNPVVFLQLSSSYKYGRSNNDYDVENETVQFITASIDSVNTKSNEFTQKITVTPLREVRSSFRYIVRDYDYMTRAQAEPDTVRTGYNSSMYVFDTTYTPRSDIFFTGSFIKEDAITRTPGDVTAQAGYVPAFEANYRTWMFSTTYTPKDYLKFNKSIYYTYADNFDDFTSAGLPYGATFKQVGLNLGFDWDVNKNVSVHPGYSFYSYMAPSYSQAGNYHAHVIGVESKINWG